MSSPPVTSVAPLRPTGLLLFASAKDEPRARRPTDIALAIAAALVLVVVTTVSRIGADLDAALADLLAVFPAFFTPLWHLLFWLPPAWAVVIVATTVVRGRRTLTRDVLVGALVAVVVGVGIGLIVTDDAWGVLRIPVDTGRPPSFPPGALTISAAVIATASPHVSLPFRHLGRWILGLQLVGALFLGATTATGAVAALAVGLLAAALVHIAVGSPGGRPTTSRIELALAGLGIVVADLAPAAMHPEGTVQFDGTDADGALSVKVYGRDAWDGQLLANLWRLAWYRGTQRTARLSRVELVEHEGFVTLLAERAGVRVPHVVTAGSAGRGDALVVVRPDGVPLSVSTLAADDTALAGLWAELRLLHLAGIAHRRVDLDRVVARADGTLGFGNLSSASVTSEPADLLIDRAQVLALSLLLVGEERATAAARAALGDDGLLPVLPFVQEPAMPTSVRDALGDGDIELDDVRGRLRAALGAPDQPLTRLRRVSWGSLLNLALLSFAAYSLIGLFADLDLATFVDELRDASWWWIAFALVLAQVPRAASAVGTMGSLQQPLPAGPLTALQFAICYVNLAIPSTAARVAINIRFFQRCGVRPATAVSAGVIDSVAGFAVQIALFVWLFFGADTDLGLSLDPDDLSGVLTIALIVLGVLVVGALVAWCVPAVRRWVVDSARQARVALRVLRSPVKLVQLVGGNVASQVLFAVALAACVEAFGADVSLTELLLINTVVSLFAGLLPVPGGIGVSEAGLTLGLTAAGLASEQAFAIALAYRFVSFYLPPIWGWYAYHWLVRRRYL